MKPISTRLHGLLDYSTAAALIALPRLLNWPSGPTQLLTASAVATLGYSLVTDYERGIVRLLPMRGHLALDALSGLTLLAAPFLLLQDEDVSVQTLVAGIGLFELTVTLLSESTPEEEDQAEAWRERSAGEIVGDRMERGRSAGEIVGDRMERDITPAEQAIRERPIQL